MNTPTRRPIALRAIAVAIGLAAGALWLLATGHNPLAVYGAVAARLFGTDRLAGLPNALPVILMALAVAVPRHAGLMNLGVAGQSIVGALTAAWLTSLLPLPAPAAVALAVVAAALSGALWNVGPALLKVRPGTHEAVTSIILAYLALTIAPALMPGRGPALAPLAILAFGAATLAALLAAYYLINRSRLGFEMRAVGHNAQAARAQGIAVGGAFFAALLIAGALAGLAGAMRTLMVPPLVSPSGPSGQLPAPHSLAYQLFVLGWDGIAVAIVAGSHPLGIVVAGWLWGALDAAATSTVTIAPSTASAATLPVEVIQAVVLAVVLFGRPYRQKKGGQR